MLKIVTVPNPILTQLVKKVKKFDQELKDLIAEMEKTLEAQVDPQGVGLAAPQVGLSHALFIIKPSKKAKCEAFINPRILKAMENTPEVLRDKSSNSTSGVKAKKKQKTKLEGCLSIPKIWGPVERAKKVYLEYQDLNNRLHRKWFSGFKAIVIQHEIDHLSGILFSQRVLEQKGKLFEEKEGKLEKLKY